MGERPKMLPLTVGIVLLAIAAFAYGALTAPRAEPDSVHTTTTSPKPDNSATQKLQQELTNELPTITSVLTAAYPKVATDYDIADTTLYDHGEWFGATLRYHGTDTLNRDTLRVLMEKVNGVWQMRTKPPTILLSAVQYPDVPKAIIQDINKVVGLP